MRARWLSTFTLIGAVLIALGVVGLVNPHFVFDPGQVREANEPWYYVVLGVLMIVNGVFTPPVPSDDKADDESKSVKTSVPT